MTEAPARSDAPVGETAFGWLRLVIGVVVVTIVPTWALGYGFFSGLPALRTFDAASRMFLSAVAATALEGAVIGLALAGWLAAHVVSRALDRRSAASQRARYAEIGGEPALRKDTWADAVERAAASEPGDDAS